MCLYHNERHHRMDTEIRHRGFKPKDDEERVPFLQVCLRLNILGTNCQLFVLKEDELEEGRIHDNANDGVAIPWKGVLFALALNLIGCVMLGVYFCSFFGLIEFQPEDSLSYLIITAITLIPGAYHTMIAFRAYRGDEGFNFDCFY